MRIQNKAALLPLRLPGKMEKALDQVRKPPTSKRGHNPCPQLLSGHTPKVDHAHRPVTQYYWLNGPNLHNTKV